MTTALSSAMRANPTAYLFVPVPGGYAAFASWAAFWAWDAEQQLGDAQ